MSLANEYLPPLIEKTFSEMRARITEIEREAGDRERIATAICDYVSAFIAAESKSLASSLYTKLSEETLGKEPFITARNQNKFYEKDIWAMIFDKYSFAIQEKIDYKQVNENIDALPVPLGAASFGIILSIALSKAIIIPIALIVAGGLYYFIRENKKTANTDNFVFAIDSYLESIKSGLMVWFEHIENFYHEQVEEVKVSLKE
jgi:hypothetical protein